MCCVENSGEAMQTRSLIFYLKEHNNDPLSKLSFAVIQTFQTRYNPKNTLTLRIIIHERISIKKRSRSKTKIADRRSDSFTALFKGFEACTRPNNTWSIQPTPFFKVTQWYDNCKEVFESHKRCEMDMHLLSLRTLRQSQNRI